MRTSLTIEKRGPRSLPHPIPATAPAAPPGPTDARMLRLARRHGVVRGHAADHVLIDQRAQALFASALVSPSPRPIAIGEGIAPRRAARAPPHRRVSGPLQPRPGRRGLCWGRSLR